MRVAFVGTGDADLDKYPPGGGIEHQVWILAKELAKRGHDVDILTRSAGGNVAPGVTLVHVPTWGRGHVLPKMPMSLRAWRALRREPPDVLYLSEKWVSWLPSRLDVPRIYATHNKDAFESYREQSYHDHKLNRALFPLKQRLEEAEMRRCDVVGANSPSILDYVRSRGMANADLLPLAVDLTHHHPGVESDPPFIFASGQLLKVKGTHDIISAFASVAGDHPTWRLRIGGQGPERPRLESLATTLGIRDRVDLLGWMPHAQYLATMREAAMFVLASSAETFGTVLLDAMASSRPTLATDIPGPRDVVLHERTGLLVPPGDVKALANAMVRLMTDASLRERFGREGERRAREAFSPQAAADAFERLARLAQERHQKSF